jgi:pimeloyl-ACP methyl ester carboxylesterase
LLVRTLYVVLALVAALLLLESGLETRDRHHIPMPGRLVSVDGRRVHVVEAGGEHAGPVVLLECGIGGATAADWAWVERGVAAFAHVVAYDRAGLGRSTPGRPPPDGRHLVEELHATLAAAAIRAPLVFVGHSYGGLLARLYADRYPGDVCGVVLLESSHPRQFQAFGHPGVVHLLSWLLPAAPWVARLGGMRLVLPFLHLDADLLPPYDRALKRAYMAAGPHWDGLVGELREWRTRTSPEAAATHGFGDRPLGVVTAGESVRGRPAWARLQAEAAQLSSNSFHVIEPGATHAGLITDSTHAAHVVSVIREVWAAADSGRRVAAPAGFAAAP